MNFTEILFEIEEGIAVITLNRPKARNALAPVMRQELALALKTCLLYTSPSPRDLSTSRMPSSA